MELSPPPLFLFLFLLPVFFLTSCADAHGFLGKVTIDGTDFAGPSPQDPPSSSAPSAIRQVADISPVKGASNDDLRCGLSAAAAAQEASAKAGSVVEFWWTGGGGQEWPHNTGPLMTYMAECTNGDCTSFDPANAKWFKIDQLGMNSDSTWYQAVFMQGKSLSVTLPTALAAGHYLLRSEIIALHNAIAVGGAEFYPACVQLNVASSGADAVSAPSPTVSFPGAYTDTDPGIDVPGIYDPGLDYVFPGG
ncbi:glycoside hydrolase, partial [Amylostereum chailletii]